MEKMKIAIMGDAQDQEVINYALFLTEKGHDVRLYSARKPLNSNVISKSLLFKKISTVSYPLTYLTFVFTSWHILRNKPDLIHAINLSDYGVLGSLYARLTGIKPIILTSKGQDIMHDAKTQKGWAIKHMMPLGSLFLSENELAAQEMIKTGAPVSKIRVIDSKNEEQLNELEKLLLEMTATKRCLREAKAEINTQQPQ